MRTRGWTLRLATLLGLGGGAWAPVSFGAEPSAEVRGRDAGALYAELCATCHGDKLQGAKGPGLRPYQLNHGADEEVLFQGILKGYPSHGMPGFAQAIVEVVLRHDAAFDPASMEMRSSKAANYLSLTCTVRVTSREQLDALYQALCDHPMVVMVL